MKLLPVFGALVHLGAAHFLQCKPADSLELVSELDSHHGLAQKQGVTCPKWPFYSGGFAKHYEAHSSSSSSSDSSSSEDDAHHGGKRESLLPDNLAADSVLTGFGDGFSSFQCVESADNYCLRWVGTEEEYVESRCKHAHDTVTSYQLCLCAEDNVGGLSDGAYCGDWACLELASYPVNASAYSLVVDNSFVSDPRHHHSSSSSSSSSSDGSDSDDSSSESREEWRSSSERETDAARGDYYRFALDGEVLELDPSMSLSNCWCAAGSLNGEFCLNHYCEGLAHDEHGCHTKGFGVDSHGWFGCFDNAQDEDTSVCASWYGFMVDDAVRGEQRCECVDAECLSWQCGETQMFLRQNWMWWNFPLALLLWGCCFGCCATKCCFRKDRAEKCLAKPFAAKWCKCFKRRKCRLLTLFVVVGVISLFHGGVPAFMFFALLFSCSLCCARKRERCGGCCSRRRRCKTKVSMEKLTTSEMVHTTVDGENSKEESVEVVPVPEQPVKSASGHVRLNSVDLDEVGDEVEV